MANHTFYTESVVSWNREWGFEGEDMEEMGEEARAAFEAEMDTVNAEAAEERMQERRDLRSGFVTTFTHGESDMPF